MTHLSAKSNVLSLKPLLYFYSLECMCECHQHSHQVPLHHGEWVLVRASPRHSLMARIDALLPLKMYVYILLSYVTHGSSCTLTLGLPRSTSRGQSSLPTPD